jgi:hypothetical protein
MTIQELFIRANVELKKVIDQIDDNQWSMNMPAGITSKPATLKEAINYHAYDDAWVPDVLAGLAKEEVGDKFESILDSNDPKGEYAKYNIAAIEAVGDFEDLDKTVHLSYGDFPAREYLQHIISFRGFRVHDIAKVIGADTKMADDLVQGLWDELTPHIEGYRQMGVFPPALEVSDNADLQTKLLALVGREN